MNNSFHFDYNKFYKYYTTDSNLETDTTEKYTNYYPKTYSKIPKRETLSKKFIWINNKQVYITQIIENEKDELLFSLPPEENTSERWDDHFHFGIDHNIRIKDPITNKNKKVTGVFFHKTVQHPETGGGKELISCYFPPKMEINRDMKNFEEMKCLQRGYNMNQLYTERDFHYLNEIISKPFPPESENKKPSFRDALTHNSSSHKNTKHNTSGKKHKGGTRKKTRKYRRKTIRRR